MNALRYERKQLHLAEVPPPLLGGEALVRVMLSGICNTDLEIARGYAGFEGTLGHEFVGVIEEVSEARPSGRATLVSTRDEEIRSETVSRMPIVDRYERRPCLRAGF
jgi:threonine dehydrogenase-like Zn-dependent dehydrogenase